MQTYELKLFFDVDGIRIRNNGVAAEFCLTAKGGCLADGEVWPCLEVVNDPALRNCTVNGKIKYLGPVPKKRTRLIHPGKGPVKVKKKKKASKGKAKKVRLSRA